MNQLGVSACFGGRVPSRVLLSAADDTAVAVSRPKQVALLVESLLPDFRRTIVIRVVPYCCIKLQFVVASNIVLP